MSEFEESVRAGELGLTQEAGEVEEIIDDWLRETDDQYRTHGVISDASELVVPTEFLNNHDAVEGFERVMRLKAEGLPIQPLYFVEHGDGTITPVLAREDAECVELGYVCPNCLQWQEDCLRVTNHCHWLGVSKLQAYWGCGYIAP